MCGICCIFGPSAVCDKLSLEDVQCNSRICNRGPDGHYRLSMSLSDGTSAVYIGHVLHLRGDEMAVQPARDCQGNILLWNAEIFGGLNVPDTESDTTVLLNLLSQCNTDEEMVSLLAKIEGPWSFIYWQVSTSTLWFGRDVFGRRSLLWHLPESTSDIFALSSVQIKPHKYREVPSVGIYKMSVTGTGDGIGYNFTLLPWTQAVWPGTLDKIKDDQNFSANICGDEACMSISKFCISPVLEVPSKMPELNKSLPPADYCLPDLPDDMSHTNYLQNLLTDNSYLRTLSKQLTSVLLDAVKTRVLNQHIIDRVASPHVDSVQKSVANDDQTTVVSTAGVAILFSGGIDSTMIAALADKCVPANEPIDLLNVAFELKPKENKTKKGKPLKTSLPAERRWDVPDRLTGYTALSELNPDRTWNFIEVNVTAEELQEARQAHIQDLVYPLQTVLDDSIGCAVWFASRGVGVCTSGTYSGQQMKSSARVILCGMGADEQLIGYSRHRVKFKEGGWSGLINEIELEVTRISARNLGRDDRIITDHGKESRFPFLDERVVQFLSSLPVYDKANLMLPRGLGEKLLLRLSAVDLGLAQTACLAKRAIQFGSRIAKLENSKERASDICSRLNKTTVSGGEESRYKMYLE